MHPPLPPRPESYTLPPSLLSTAQSFAQTLMSTNDASHDAAHILRVLRLATHLTHVHPSRPSLDSNLITLSALLHDINDSKYPSSLSPLLWLQSQGCPPSVAQAVDTIVAHVSYSTEIRDLDRVKDVLEVFPELGVVQDADRLDALGAVGVARCFVFGGVMRGSRGLEGCVGHMKEKLMRLEGLMKTEEGRRLAGIRGRRVGAFLEWWEAETVGEVEGMGGMGVEAVDSYEGFENI